MLSKIKQLTTQYAQEFIEVRHHLHANPELSYKEFNTSKFIQNKLTEFGIEFQVMATTGVVAIIEGNNPSSRIIALRADMDALPILEENNVPYKIGRASISARSAIILEDGLLPSMIATTPVVAIT